MPRIDGLFDEVIKRGASDLHLAAGYPPLARIRGELVAMREQVVNGKDLDEVLLELVTPAQRARLQADLGLEFAHAHKNLARFRASYFAKSSGIGAVFRVVPARVLTLAELACPEVLWRLADRRSGLVLVTGARSSGRSSTVGAMLDHINKTRACHVVTIESPIELVHEPLRAQVTHREIGAHAPSYAAALRNASRENADVVFVSELRTAETTRLALQLAGQGVLVFAMLDTNGAAATIGTLVRQFPDEEQAQARGMLADTLAGVVSQHLLTTIDGKSRVAAHEILLGSSSVSALIREGSSAQLADVMQAAHGQGMQTLDASLEKLVSQKRVSAEDALDRAVNREEFARFVARVRPDLAETL